MSNEVYEPEYLEGIAHFNRHDFFEAHEAWEAIWARTTGPNQLFYKGLIHAAVALHHFGNGNLRGARKVFGSCVQYLRPYARRRLGLDVAALLAALDACFEPLVRSDSAARGVELDESQIPEITLDPPAAAAEEE
jgi:hypothetical protein